MKQIYDVKDKRALKRLVNSKRFIEYPKIFLSNTCKVKVNADDWLRADEFTICSKTKILPKRIYIYGKKTQNHIEEDNLYLNYWMKVFFKTVEKGKLFKHDFEKSNSKLELTIGIPIKFRANAYKLNTWTRLNVIEFLSCLFNIPIEEAEYEQQDLIEQLMAA